MDNKTSSFEKINEQISDIKVNLPLILSKITKLDTKKIVLWDKDRSNDIDESTIYINSLRSLKIFIISRKKEIISLSNWNYTKDIENKDFVDIIISYIEKQFNCSLRDILIQLYTEECSNKTNKILDKHLENLVSRNIRKKLSWWESEENKKITELENLVKSGLLDASTANEVINVLSKKIVKTIDDFKQLVIEWKINFTTYKTVLKLLNNDLIGININELYESCQENDFNEIYLKKYSTKKSLSTKQSINKTPVPEITLSKEAILNEKKKSIKNKLWLLDENKVNILINRCKNINSLYELTENCNSNLLTIFIDSIDIETVLKYIDNTKSSKVLGEIISNIDINKFIKLNSNTSQRPINTIFIINCINNTTSYSFFDFINKTSINILTYIFNLNLFKIQLYNKLYEKINNWEIVKELADTRKHDTKNINLIIFWQENIEDL